MSEKQTQTAIRLSDALIERIDKLAERMSQEGMRVTRAEVLRLAAHRGVNQLEQGAALAGRKSKR